MPVYGISLNSNTRVGGNQLIVMKESRPVDSEYAMEIKIDGIYRHLFFNRNVGINQSKNHAGYLLCTITPNEGR